MIKSFGKIAIATLIASVPFTTTLAAPVVINFDEPHWADGNTVGSYYAPYAFFSSNGAIAQDGGVLGMIESQSIPNSLNFWDSGTGTMSVPLGFNVSSFNFFYSNPGEINGTVTFSGGTLNTPFVINLNQTSSAGDAFEFWDFASGFGPGIATVVTFDSDDNASLAFDDFEFVLAPEGWSVSHEQPVPEPSTVIGGLALAALTFRRFMRSRK
jgi:hypothetical protein